MRNVGTWLAWLMTALIIVFAVLNWSTLMISAPLNLVLVRIEAPLGVVLLGVMALLMALFFVAYLRNQIGSLLETRKLLKEVQRVQDLADKAEVSRIDNLHQLIATEFRLLNERLNATPVRATATTVGTPFRPLSMTEILTGQERS